MSDRIDAVESAIRAEPQRWLVTGGAGFIGSHLVQRLLELDQEVAVLDDLSTGKRANLRAVADAVGLRAENLHFIEGDIRDPAAAAAAVTGVSRVLHQAALGSIPRSLHDPERSMSVNIDGFVRVLEAARAAEVGSFVYASSSSVYGGVAELPARETGAAGPISPYAASKLCNEVLAKAWATAYGSPVVGLRYFNVCGARQSSDPPYATVIPRWIRELRAGQRPTLFGDGHTSRDFCPVEDVVQANLLAATADPSCHGKVYNVALGQVTEMGTLFRMVCESVADSGVNCRHLTPVFGDLRAGDVPHSHADLSASRAELGYAPTGDLRAAIRAAVASA